MERVLHQLSVPLQADQSQEGDRRPSFFDLGVVAKQPHVSSFFEEGGLLLDETDANEQSDDPETNVQAEVDRAQHEENTPSLQQEQPCALHAEGTPVPLPPTAAAQHESRAPRLSLTPCTESKAREEAALRERHEAFVRIGLRYVNAPGGNVKGVLDGGRDAPGKLRHGLPVRILAVSGNHSKVVREGYSEGVWIQSASLLTEAPSGVAAVRPSFVPRARPMLPTMPTQSTAQRPDEPRTPAPTATRRCEEPKTRRCAEPRSRCEETRRYDERFEEPRIDASQLPEDAPEGHPAHVRVRFNGTHQNPLVNFRFEGVAFQTTVTAAGSRQAAEVIARACFIKFEQGESKEAVLRFRAECYARSNPHGISPKVPAKRIKIDHQPCSTEEVVAEVRASESHSQRIELCPPVEAQASGERQARASESPESN